MKLGLILLLVFSILIISVTTTSSYTFILDDTLIPNTNNFLYHNSGRRCDDFSSTKIHFETGKDTSNLHGFIHTVHTAFQNHYTLILKPTDIWQTILFTLSNHIADNAEDLRDLFVNFQEKKTIQVKRDHWTGLDNHSELDWMDMIQELSYVVSKEISNTTEVAKQLAEAYILDFPTVSTAETRYMSQLTLMSGMQHYFKYDIITACGIPKIEMKGQIEDWEMLKTKLKQLNLEHERYKNKLTIWSHALQFFIQQLINSRNGNPNLVFWRSFYKFESGSGGDKFDGFVLYLFNKFYNPDRINEHTHFTVEMKPSQYLSTLPSGLVKVPFNWNYFGQEHKLMLLSGFGDTIVHHNNTSVETSFFWKIQNNIGNVIRNSKNDILEEMREHFDTVYKLQEMIGTTYMDRLRNITLEIISQHYENNNNKLYTVCEKMNKYDLIYSIFNKEKPCYYGLSFNREKHYNINEWTQHFRCNYKEFYECLFMNNLPTSSMIEYIKIQVQNNIDLYDYSELQLVITNSTNTYINELKSTPSNKITNKANVLQRLYVSDKRLYYTITIELNEIQSMHKIKLLDRFFIIHTIWYKDLMQEGDQSIYYNNINSLIKDQIDSYIHYLISSFDKKRNMGYDDNPNKYNSIILSLLLLLLSGFVILYIIFP